MSSREPEPGDRWQHCKTEGNYLVLTLATDEADQKAVVVYQSLTTARRWTRKLDNWLDPGRFELVSEGHVLPPEPLLAAVSRVLQAGAVPDVARALGPLLRDLQAAYDEALRRGR